MLFDRNDTVIGGDAELLSLKQQRSDEVGRWAASTDVIGSAWNQDLGGENET